MALSQLLIYIVHITFVFDVIKYNQAPNWSFDTVLRVITEKIYGASFAISSVAYQCPSSY